MSKVLKSSNISKKHEEITAGNKEKDSSVASGT